MNSSIMTGVVVGIDSISFHLVPKKEVQMHFFEFVFPCQFYTRPKRSKT